MSPKVLRCLLCDLVPEADSLQLRTPITRKSSLSCLTAGYLAGKWYVLV